MHRAPTVFFIYGSYNLCCTTLGLVLSRAERIEFPQN